MAYWVYDFWRKNLVKMKKAFYNYFKEIFDRSLYYGMNYNAHWNRNFEAVSPQASDCASQFITWFNLVNILWKKYEPYWERPPGRRGEAASFFHMVPPYNNFCKNLNFFIWSPLVRLVFFSKNIYFFIWSPLIFF